jgi:LysM repeat protein
VRALLRSRPERSIADAVAVAVPPEGEGGGRTQPRLRSLALVAGLAVAGSAATGSYTVRVGDTVSEIAVRHGVSTADILGANGIRDRHRIVAGSTIAIPAAGRAGAAPAAPGSHTVQPGDTLSQIAARLGVSTSALAAANGITDHHKVVAGRQLVVPAGGRGTATAAAPAAPVAGGGHRVRSGETLSELAKRFGVSTSALAAANGISDVHSLAAGKVLTVPGRAATPTVAPAAAARAATSTSTAPRGLPLRLQQSPSRLALIPTFERWAAHYGVPADLLMATTWLESGWQNHVVSPVGAVGIGQIMPDTTAWMRDILIREPLDPSDPNDNIRMSARYLRWLLDRSGGDARIALAGYYQGPASVDRSGLYAVTEAYVTNVLSFRDRHF